MTKSTPVPIDGRDVILRDKYRAIVAQYSSEIVETLQAVKYDTEADTARLVKCVRDLDNARQQLLNIEVKLSYEESKSKETCGETDIDFDAMRQAIGRRLDRLRRCIWRKNGMAQILNFPGSGARAWMGHPGIWQRCPCPKRRSAIR